MSPQETKLSGEDQIAAEIVRTPAQTWLSEQYLPYTMYVIRSRSLVNVDGMKPVNRRTLYTLYKEGLTPTTKHMKAARACGLVTAFHPHGDSSIESALARMTQSYSLRVPLIDAAGFAGAITGDTPAAARYWECRLSRAAMDLLKEIPDGAVPLGKNFDGELDEPHLLPVRWPVNIINGTEGIAVGYASKMYAHNPDETMKACISYLKNPEMTVDELLNIMPGPDLPTGGELFGIDGIREYYETGSGTFTIRGKYKVENLSRGRVRVIFHELPYQISPDDVMAKIAKMQSFGKLKEISTVKDLSDMKNGLRLVIETKVGTNHLSILNELFKSTPLESKMSVNGTVLVDNTPIRVSMLQLIDNFINFRKACTIRKAETRITKINSRIYQLEAILAALVDIDKCIAIIRSSESADEARSELVKEFSIQPDQADYILSMQLRRLTKADAVAINQESAELLEERAEMKLVTTSEEKLAEYVERELHETAKIISDKRRTTINGLTSDQIKAAAKEEAQAARDENKNITCYITRFVDGTLIKTTEPFTYDRLGKKFEHSPIVEQIKAKTQDGFVIVSSDGIGYRLPLSYLKFDVPATAEEAGSRMNPGSKIVAIAKGSILKTDIGLLLGTRNGEVKLVRPDLPNKEEFTVFSLADGDEIIGGRWLGRATTGSRVVSITKHSNCLVYDTTSLRAVGAPAGGIKSQKLVDGDEVVYFGWVPSARSEDTFVLTQSNATIKITPIRDIPSKGKGSQGVVVHKFRKGDTHLVQATVGSNLVMSAQGLGNAITAPPATKRAATGVDFTLKTEMGSAEIQTM